MGDLNQIKVFTREEAEALLPMLTDFLNRARAVRDEIQKLEIEIDLEELVQEEGQPSRLDARVEDYNHKIADFYSLIEKIHEPGCFLKDAGLGLIDFYSMREGKVVYLCWKQGEEHIRFWHEVGQGFSSREAL